MSTQSLLEKMNAMKLHGMSRALTESMHSVAASNLATDELLTYCINAEYDDRHHRLVTRRLKRAKLKQNAFMKEIDFSASRSLNKNQIKRFSETNWISAHENIIINGKTGSGKSYLACAIAHAMCMEGFSARYEHCLKLFSNLKLAKADGSYANEIKKISKTDVLLLDDFGLEPFDAMSRLMLLEILDDRHGTRSMIIATQLPVEKWHELIGDETIADAICDRLIHNAHIINIGGDNMRRKMKKVG